MIIRLCPQVRARIVRSLCPRSVRRDPVLVDIPAQTGRRDQVVPIRLRSVPHVQRRKDSGQDQNMRLPKIAASAVNVGTSAATHAESAAAKDLVPPSRRSAMLDRRSVAMARMDQDAIQVESPVDPRADRLRLDPSRADDRLAAVAIAHAGPAKRRRNGPIVSSTG